mgnify:CR=1 FL=1|jgi:Endoglucanase
MLSSALTLAFGAALSFVTMTGCGDSGGAAVQAPPSRPAAVSAPSGAFGRVEARFELPGLTGNPFDYTENDIRVTFALPGGGTAQVPAFFDGGQTWRVRYAPPAAGELRITGLTRNGAAVEAKGLEPKTFTVGGKAGRGFVRLDPKDPLRFAYADGTPYYPVGLNVGWSGNTPKGVTDIFVKMGENGLNWSRVWMCHWDGKNLDWVMGTKNEPGTLSLDVARRWDAILAGAEKQGIGVQVVLQHHGQYSSTVNPNWGENPWNAANGGFLNKPEEFFTNAKAKALTRAKYRYIVARYGAFPSVLSWELFNEVEWTDAIRGGKPETVAAWHKEMATFLREQDPHGHLVCTSSDTKIPGLYDAMDYVQPHHYPNDAVGAVTAHDPAAWKKPVFIGEIGPQGNLNGDDGAFLRHALWASLMTRASGAAQYWTWDHIERRGLFGAFKPAAEFARAADLGAWSGTSQFLPVTTSVPGSVSGGPGRGWEAVKRTEYNVLPSGRIEGIEEMSSFLQGTGHRDMFEKATFHVTMPAAGQVRVRLKQVARQGAHVVLSVDGKKVTERDYPAGERDRPLDDTLTADLAPGRHTVTLENTGRDWAVVDRVTFTNAGASRAALGRVAKDRAALYVWRGGARDETASGKDSKDTVEVAGLTPGRYRVIWWDVETGKEIARETATPTAGKPLTLTLPTPHDVAASVMPER